MKKRKELSAIISCWNRGYALPWALSSLVNQEIPPDEIIVVNDGSDDNTEKTVLKFQEVYPKANIKYYYNNNPGYSTCTWGNNCAIKKATKEIIMITMADVLHATDDVKVILEHFENPENDKTILSAAHGYYVYEEALRMLTQEQLSDPISITKLPNVHDYHVGYISPPDTITYFPKGTLQFICGILKKHLVAVGGYNEEYAQLKCTGGEDIDLIERLNNYGMKFIETEKMLSIHLGHPGPPPEVMTQEKYDMATLVKSRKGLTSETNVGKEWGILRK